MGPEVGHSCAGDVNVSETLNALFSAWPNPLPPAEGVAPVPTWVGLEDRPPPPPAYLPSPHWSHPCVCGKAEGDRKQERSCRARSLGELEQPRCWRWAVSGWSLVVR